MAQSVQEHAYVSLPRRDSDSHLPAGASAEEGLQNLELCRDPHIPQKPPGSGLIAPDPSGSPTATAAVAADLPSSELELQRAWKVADWIVTLFLCTSVVLFIVRLTVTAGLCLCIGIAAGTAHLWRRVRGNNSAQALNAALKTYYVVMWLAVGVIICGAFSTLVTCAPDMSDCPFRPVFIVTIFYVLSALIMGIALCVRQQKLFPPPTLRQLMQEYTPLTAQDQKAQRIRHSMQKLEREENTIMAAFNDARCVGNRERQDKAHRQWKEVGQKLKKLKEELEQCLQHPAPPTVAV